MPASLMPMPKQAFYGLVNGVMSPIVGGKVYTYKAGTLTPKDTYTTAAGTVANPNPVILDARGEASVWLGSGAYDIVLKGADDALIWTQEGVSDVKLDLASTADPAKGAALVGYKNRTLADFLDDFVLIKNYSAVGDGISNDSSAISSAIDDANTRGVPVLLESGKTYLCGAISKSRVHLVCFGSATIKAASGIAAGTSVITSDDILLDGVSVDGDSKVTRAVTATGKYRQRRSSISNVVGTAVSFGRLVYATSACTEFDVDDSCYFSGVSGVENGTEGDTSGADCGLYIEASLFSIVGATFTNIGGYEDGDCIRVQLPADAALLWASAARSKIAYCKFPEIKKRAIKCQASDVLIYGNAVTSTVVTDPSCPYAAIDIYGSQNTVAANRIDLARAVSGIIDNGKNNVIEGNSVRVAAATAYTTARTSATSGIRNQSSIGSRVSKNNVISKTFSSFYVYQSEDSIHANNRVSGDAAANQVGIYVDAGSGNLQIGNNISGTSGAKLRYGVQVDSSVYNRVFSNIFDQMTAGIRYNGTTQASRNGGNVFGSGVSNIIDYTGVGASTAQTIGDHDGSVVANVSPGSIAAHGTYSADVSWPPVAVGNVYAVSPASSGTTLESGLLISVEPKSAGVVTLKVHNITASPITPAARNYKIRAPM